VVEGARLESAYTDKGIKGSNPFLSAIIMLIKLNNKIFVIKKNNIFWQNFINQRWESINFKIYKKYINFKTNYYDVGAWIGPTFFIAASLSPKKIYSFEPDIKAFRELKKNILYNKKNLKKIIINTYNKAAYTKNCNKKLYIPIGQDGNSISSLVKKKIIKYSVHNIKCLNFFDFLNNKNLNSNDFIKIDIEGGEYELIPFVGKIIRKTKPNIYLSLHPFLLNGFFNKIINNNKLLSSLRGYKYVYIVKKNKIFESKLLRILINLRLPIIKNIKESLIFTNKKFYK